MSKVNELRQRFAQQNNNDGASSVSAPGGSGESRLTVRPASQPGSKIARPPLPSLPPPNKPKYAGNNTNRSSFNTDSNSTSSFLHSNIGLKSKTDDYDYEDTSLHHDESQDVGLGEDLYLTPAEELKQTVSTTSVAPISAFKQSSNIVSPKLPPPRKSSNNLFNRQQLPAVSGNGDREGSDGGGSGDGSINVGSSSVLSHSLTRGLSPKKSSESSCLAFQYFATADLFQPMYWEDDLQTRGASRMGFGTDLQDKTAHDAILRLGDQELKLMESLKRIVQHKLKADKEYATSLSAVGTLANKFEEDSQIKHQSQVVKAWTTIVYETENISKLTRQHADEMNTVIVDKLAMMIKDKTELKKQYIQERTKIDLDYIKVKGEVKEMLSRYQKACKESKESKSKVDEAVIKGKVKDLDRAKDRYKKSVVKLHKAHNDYVLSLKAATLHQEHYRTSILPRLLECLQQSQESQITQIKQVMMDYCNLSSTCMGDFVSSQSSVMRSIADVRPDTEYSNFVSAHKVESPAREYFDFDTSIMEEIPEGLEENAIVLDNLTLESVQHTHTSLADSRNEVFQNLTTKKQELQSLDEEIRSIQPSPTDENVVLDLLCKQKIYRDVSREIQDLKCQEAKLNAQFTMLDQKLLSMGEDENLPPGFELPDIPTLPATLTKSSTLTTQPEKKKISIGSGVTRLFGKRNTEQGEQQKQSSCSDIPIEDEEWYHGALPRLETEELLVNDGDFVVREKGDASGQYVLSTKTNGRVRHFPIQLNEDNMYRLEGRPFPSVGHLIRYQLSSGTPVTKATQACLIHPVAKVKSEHDLRHEEIELGDKLGAGHFGDVFRGKLRKDGTAVAVKTCKETVEPATRRKFLMEANILKQYNHSNIVKLIGVCTDKHPIYIVMELVPGGDLLSFLRNDENDISTRQMVKMSEDTGAGMAFLEAKNCIHRDLAARNCLVGHKSIIKISDFGMSREDDVYTIKGGAMRQIPIKWTAPEAMNYGKYTTMSDVWSFGILLWEIFSHGSTPYPGMNNTEAREKVEQEYRMPPSHGTPDEIYTLMMRCWEYVDEKRPKFKEIHAILKRLSKTIK